MIGLIIYFIGVAVQYVRVNTVHKEWKEERLRICKKECEPAVSVFLSVWGSWVAFALMSVKRFLDNKFINK